MQVLLEKLRKPEESSKEEEQNKLMLLNNIEKDLYCIRKNTNKNFAR